MSSARRPDDAEKEGVSTAIGSKRKSVSTPAQERNPRRTHPSHMTVRHLAGMGSGRVVSNHPGAYIPPSSCTTTEVRPSRREECLPSHGQVCELVARCLSERVYAKRFRKAFLRHPYDDDSPSARSGGRLCLTPVDRLEKALAFVFCDRDVHSSLVINPGEISPGGHNIFGDNDPEQQCMFGGEWLQFFVMDCILDRQLRRSRNPVGTLTPVKVKAYSKEEMLSSSDALFCSAVTVVPDVGLFYCVCERYPAATGGASTGDDDDHGDDGCDHGQDSDDSGDSDDGGDSNDGGDSDDSSDDGGGRPFLPLELSWLRIRRHNKAASEPCAIGDTSSGSPGAGWFAAGGYVVCDHFGRYWFSKCLAIHCVEKEDFGNLACTRSVAECHDYVSEAG